MQADPLPEDTPLYVNHPPGYNQDPDEVWHIMRPLYGLSCAPRAWADTLSEFFLSQGWTQSRNDDTVFSYHLGKHPMILTSWVDDILMDCHDDDAALAQRLCEAILARFGGKSLCQVERFICMDVEHPSEYTYTLSQERAIISLL